jgi:hypothetical protein
MKHLKLFESFKDIDSICKEYGIKNYVVNEDGLVDVEGDVDISESGIKKIPLKFGKVSGNFNCNYNNLTNLEGAPSEVGGHFICHDNKLTSLEGCPIEVGGDFNCYDNKLTSLEGCPKEVGGNFICSQNNLISLEGAPSRVSGDFTCSFNKLTSLEGCPREVVGEFSCYWNQLTSLEGGPSRVGKYFDCRSNNLFSLEGLPFSLEGFPIDGRNLYCGGNPIDNIKKLFPNLKSYRDSLDYNYLRGTNIIKWRLKEALEEVGRDLPESIPGYMWI